jgi:hypothetical protein
MKRIQEMSLRTSRLAIIGLVTILGGVACASEPTPTPVDIVGTIAAQLASDMLTQTVAAYSPTPPPPTITLTPTQTPTPEAVFDPDKRTVTVVGKAPCYFGPGPTYILESYISDTKKVELLGIGSVPGWYIVMNPYFHQACWLAAENVHIDTNLDISQFPTITP